MLAYTGLETVANLAEETREPGKTLPRSLFSAIGLVVIVTVLIATIGVVAYPAVARIEPRSAANGSGRRWSGSPKRSTATSPAGLVDTLRVLVGLSGGLILFAAATTSMSGCTRLLHSMGGHEQLPRVFGRLDRRSLVAPAAIVAPRSSRIGNVIAADSLANDEVTFLASAYSFGVLLAFTAAQAAVIRLRVQEPDLPGRSGRDPRCAGEGAPAAGPDRRAAHVRGLDPRDDHAPGRALRRPCVGRAAASSSISSCAAGSATACSSDIDPIGRAAAGRRVRARAGADEAR